jgi:proteic killer suppression protein
MIITQVKLSKDAQKNLLKIPVYIKEKLLLWINMVEQEGLINSRKIPGFHDELLKGSRKGQRSIRLNKGYRAIYTESTNHTLSIILIIEVNKHDY